MSDGLDAAHWMIGVDVGGTKVAAGFVNASGELAEFLRVPMNPRGTAEEGFSAVTTAIDALLKRRQVEFDVSDEVALQSWLG